MEPANLNSPRADDALDTMLRASARALPDDGFSQRVIAALPPPPPAVRVAPARIALCLVAAGIGAVVAAMNGFSLDGVVAAGDPLRTSLVQVGEALLAPKSLLALAVAAVSTIFALRSGGRRLLRL